MADYITGEKLRQRWNIEKFELMSKITTDGQRDFNPSLTPISAAFFKPYECVIRVYVGESMRREMPEYHLKTPGDIFNKLDNVLFCLADVEAWESTHDTGKTPSTVKAENYFQRTVNHWEIKFQNEFAAHLDHVDGLAYIAHILSTKGGGISDIQLYSIAKGGAPEADSNEKTAIENGLYIQAKYQESHDTQAHRKILAKFNQLKIDLENAESILEKKEIEDDMRDLLSHMKQRNIGGQEEKAAQANISKRLKIAYSALERGGMKDLADHLRKNIKTANYGREYTGAIAWEIIL
jgi:hypothetical protein